MSLFRLSPESTHSEVLHEAILDSVSGVRDSLPEQHRAHFETLRQEIIDFVASHGIPREALSKSDTLRKAAEKLPTSDLEQLALLLERFEHLIVKKEPWTNKEALEYAEAHYHLREQYDSQVSLLKDVGILKEGAILGIDNKKYPIPTLEQIASRLFERRETLRTKHDQGFTKLLLVPFGMSLDTLQETLKQFLLSYKQKNSFFNINAHGSLCALWGGDTGDSPNLVYKPQSFDLTGHQGKTKAQILKEQEDNQDSFPGWTVHLLQPSNPSDSDSPGFASISRKGQGTPHPSLREGGDRPSLEAGKSPDEYLSILQKAQGNKNSPYHGETGMTPEDWIIAFMTHLTEKGQPMDDYKNGMEKQSYLIGAFFPFALYLPLACWDRDCHEAILDEGYGTYGHRGIRTSVLI